MNHVLDDADGCTLCGVSWTGLTATDRTMLTTGGKCLGRPDKWRRCLYSGAWCRGQTGHEDCPELVSSTEHDWGTTIGFPTAS